MSKSTVQIWPALAVAITAIGATWPAYGQAPSPTPHQFVITENSPTNLTATYDGLTTGISVIPLSPDQWFITIPPNLMFNSLNVLWAEPEDSTLANSVSFSLIGVSVLSDTFTISSRIPDGSTVSDVGIDTVDQASISATFNDNAAASEKTIPETKTSFLLFLGLALIMGLAFLRRKIPA